MISTVNASISQFKTPNLEAIMERLNLYTIPFGIISLPNTLMRGEGV